MSDEIEKQIEEAEQQLLTDLPQDDEVVTEMPKIKFSKKISQKVKTAKS